MIKNLDYQINDTRIFPGFYNTILFNDGMEERFNTFEWDCTDDEHETEYEIKDFGLYKQNVSREIANIIQSYLLDENKIFTKSIFKEVDSPKSYNYSTDKLILSIDVDLDLLKDKILNNPELKEGFNIYLHDNYTSRSGFVSLVENNVDDYFVKSYEEYYDIAIDYLLLCKIYNATDFHDLEYEESDYYYHLMDIANDKLWYAMEPIE